MATAKQLLQFAVAKGLDEENSGVVLERSGLTFLVGTQECRWQDGRLVDSNGASVLALVSQITKVDVKTPMEIFKDLTSPDEA